jgi:hypothetical protein
LIRYHHHLHLSHAGSCRRREKRGWWWSMDQEERLQRRVYSPGFTAQGDPHTCSLRATPQIAEGAYEPILLFRAKELILYFLFLRDASLSTPRQCPPRGLSSFPLSVRCSRVDDSRWLPHSCLGTQHSLCLSVKHQMEMHNNWRLVCLILVFTSLFLPSPRRRRCGRRCFTATHDSFAAERLRPRPAIT